ncbi:hypothetical protein [Pannonibacter indicus]
MGWVDFVGVPVKNAILFCAGLLKLDGTPGLVALLFFVALAALAARFWLEKWRQAESIEWMREIVQDGEEGSNFSSQIDEIGGTIQTEAEGDSYRKPLATAWGEYRETLVSHDEDGVTVLRNAVRPSVFLNTDDLGFGPGSWRIVPGLFVSMGLFFTFLGLISALDGISAETEITAHAMQDLLKVASAKFIMSLTGLLCSIMLTVLYRRMQGKVDKKLHALCHIIESKLTYISLEYLAAEQLRATREQKEHFRLIGMELVSELGRPLREELPFAISNSINTAMAPLVERVGQMGVEGVGDMVTGLSSQLTDKVGLALTEAAQRISDAGDKISLLSDRMDMSSGRMGAEMETAVQRVALAVEELRSAMASSAETAGSALSEGTEKLLRVMNQTLEGIRDNTGEGARAMSAAAEDLRKSATAFRDEIEAAAKSGSEAAQARMQAASSEASAFIGSAGQGVADAFSRTSSEIARVAAEVSAKAADDILTPITTIAGHLSDVTGKLQQGSADLRRFAEGVRDGAEASTAAATGFRSAAKDLMVAAAPVQAISERMEASIRQLTDSTQRAAGTIAKSAETTAQSAASTMAAVNGIVQAQASAIDAKLAAINIALDNLRKQGDRLDSMDESLGKAFDIYTSQVQAAVDGMFGHVRELQERLNPALDTMSNIVAQMEDFSPQSRRG